MQTEAKRVCIKNGIIVDGTGRPPFRGSVTISGEKISGVFPEGETPPRSPEGAENIIDAQGAYITPGFIDIHRHGDFQALVSGDDELLNRQGITTVINGNCGMSAAPAKGPYQEEISLFLESVIGKKPDLPASCPDPVISMSSYFDALKKAKRSVHTGMLSGAGTICASVSGYRPHALSLRELQEIQEKIQVSLDSGAFGISLGIGYEPEIFYDLPGLISLLEPLRGGQIPITVHIRTEGDGADQAVMEMIQLADALEIPVHLSHMKCIGRRNWIEMCSRELSLLEEAREKGLNITMDTYPYVTGSTQLIHLIPPHFLADGVPVFLQRLEDAAFRARVTEALKKPSDSFENIVELAGFENIAPIGLRSISFQNEEGLTIQEIAEKRGKDPYELLYDILADEKGTPAMLDRYGCEEDLVRFLKDPSCSLISDAIYPAGGGLHPRVYDAFPRFLIRYVRERKLFPIETAIRKMTAQPAELFGLARGTLQADRPADLCVFRLEKLRSRADFKNPRMFPEGFDYVFTAGKAAVCQDHWTNTKTGQVLIRQKEQDW